MWVSCDILSSMKNTPLPDHARSWLNNRGINDITIDVFSIGYTLDHPMLPHGGIVIPVHDHTGQFAFNKYRRDPLDNDKPKYLYDKGSRIALFGAHRITDVTKPIVITEGELDAMVLHSMGIQAVSSTGGAMSFQEEFVDMLGEDVYLCFDNDDAGAEGMAKAMDYLPNAKVIFIPETPGVKDISDFVARGGDFHTLMKTARTYSGPEDVEEEMGKRASQWLTVRFHERYIALHDHRVEMAKRASKNPEYDGNDARTRARSVPITSLLDIPLKNKLCCLWHNEVTPSLHYYEKTNSLFCFGSCGKRYDAIDVYMHLHGVDFKSAVNELIK